MRTVQKNLTRSALALALSIAVMPRLVNGQPQSLSSVNKPSEKAGVTKLIEIVLKRGVASNIATTLAPVIGLPKAMPMKKQEVVMSDRDNDVEKRACYVIYENTDSAAPEGGAKHAVYVYIVKIKHSGLDRQTRYFRVDLNGKLEKVVLTQTKYEASGNAVRGSGVKFDQDINSPEVRKTFETEMKFWLNDWLMKEQKNAASTAKPAPAAQ